jgi:hypothetical protein
MSNADRHVILVAGMHRSGTSLVTNLLSHLGASLPSRLMPGTPPSNPQGHFEPEVLVALNDQILAGLGRSWCDWRPFPDGWFLSSNARRLANEIAAAIHVDFGDSTLFVIKDPRLCRLLPLWSTIIRQINCVPFFVLPYRNPFEVVHSLNARNGLDLFQGYMLWLEHVLDAEFETRSGPRIFVRYESLVEDPLSAVKDIVAHPSINWPHSLESVAQVFQEVTQPDLRHHRAQADALNADPGIPVWVRQVYEYYDALRADPKNPVILEKLDRVRRSLRDTTRAFMTALDYGDPRLAQPWFSEATEGLLQTLALEMRQAEAEIANGPSHCDVSQIGSQEEESHGESQRRLLHERSARISYLYALLRRNSAVLELAQSLSEVKTAESDRLRRQNQAYETELRIAHDANTHLNGMLNSVRNDLAAAILLRQQQSADEATRIERLTSELEIDRAALILAQAQTEADRRIIEQMSSDLDASRAALTSALLGAEIESDRVRREFLGSRSWRATAPLRWIARRLAKERH